MGLLCSLPADARGERGMVIVYIHGMVWFHKGMESPVGDGLLIFISQQGEEAGALPPTSLFLSCAALQVYVASKF